MSGDKWHLVDQQWNAETRINVVGPQMSIDMFCALPDGTEVVLIDVKPSLLEVGFKITGITVNDDAREAILRWGRDNEENVMPNTSVLYLLPEGYEPDVSELLNERAIKLGSRHGREGAAMFSEGLLRTHLGEEWTEDAYRIYSDAYKTGATHRKGR